MKQNIQYTGEFKKNIKELNRLYMNRVLAISPSDSCLLCNLTNRSHVYTGIVKISSIANTFWARSVNSEPEKLIEDLYVSIRIQLSNWRKDRFFKSQEVDSKRVLIVDDDVDSIKLLESSFVNEGCCVDYAKNGWEAMGRIVSQKYDLVIFDWNMPIIDGYESLCAIGNAVSLSPKIKSHWARSPMKIVTYSIQDLRKADMPLSSHFDFLANWSKNQEFKHLKAKVSQILAEI